MVLSKNELLSALNQEVKLLLHLASKTEPKMLDYRPSPKQRSLLELLQYLTILGPIHMRAVLADSFDMQVWITAWKTGKATSSAMDFAATTAALAALTTAFAELLAPVTDDELRAEIELFGRKSTRGPMLVTLVLNHYSAYRMQLFLYLKAAGREELNTLNLWAGVDRF
jgi:hypothetical protein